NLLAQVELNQLGSLASNSNFVFIPFFWDMLEDGFIQMKQKEEEKFFCQINLNLKDFGKVDLMLFLYDKNKLDLTIYAQREHFKVAIKENLQTLKKALNSVELIAVNVKLLDMKDDKKEDNLEQKYQNFYKESIFSNSIDIKA
ncbi:MAG TPA: flagellar hook-length control protein FliK, partial [Arcobacter skirrowii]|nr:flagellar hook-length control protein FliK [Aliarcobacter skirrowii]